MVDGHNGRFVDGDDEALFVLPIGDGLVETSGRGQVAVPGGADPAGGTAGRSGDLHAAVPVGDVGEVGEHPPDVSPRGSNLLFDGDESLGHGWAFRWSRLSMAVRALSMAVSSSRSRRAQLASCR